MATILTVTKHFCKRLFGKARPPAPDNLTYTFNWDNKLRKAEWPTDTSSIEIKYDPLENRVWKICFIGQPCIERGQAVRII